MFLDIPLVFGRSPLCDLITFPGDIVIASFELCVNHSDFNFCENKQVKHSAFCKFRYPFIEIQKLRFLAFVR